jgi:peptidoglycan hydrolase CwlO-like protein
MDKQQREDIQRTLGRLEGTLDQIEKKQTSMCTDIKSIQKEVTRFKIKVYSISGLVSAVFGGLSGFLTQITKP